MDETCCCCDETKKLAWDLDEILQELGLGRYQIKNFILIGLLLMFSNISPLSFTLTAGDLDYRCAIPNCDGPNPEYKPEWLVNAIPIDKYGHPKKCLRYQLVNETVAQFAPANCTKSLFTTKNETCDQWIFDTDENTIAKEFQIMCEDRKWELTLVGTVNTVGQYIGICFFGMISDKFGRKFVALMCTLISAVFGLLRALSTNYVMFVTFEFLDSLFSSGIYGAAFVLGLELVTPVLRPIAGTVMGTFYPFGAVIMGCVAWYVRDWRRLLLICYAPGLLFITYIYLIPESVRWLEMNRKHKKAVDIIKKISNINKTTLSDEVLESMKYSIKNDDEEVETKNWAVLKNALKSKHILFRLLLCSFCWFANTLVYYGLTINSVELVGHKYLNFILVNLVEVPAFITSGFIMQKYPRKPSQFAAFLLSGLGCISCQLVSSDQIYLQIVLFLVSKLMITISFNILYVYSAEMYPTELRLSLFGLSSIIGRTGSIVAPQTVLLQQYVSRHAPVLLFGAISLIAGVLSTFFPETYCKKLPDTVNETKDKK